MEPFDIDVPVLVDGAISETIRIFKEVEEDSIPKDSRGGTLLTPPDRSHLGPEKGRLDRLYERYKASPNEESLNILLGEVELFARRITVGKGGELAQYVSQSATSFQPTEISQDVAISVAFNLNEFHGKSKFSVWVFRIAQNRVKDECRSIINRRAVQFLEWKGYDDVPTSGGRVSPAEYNQESGGMTGGYTESLPTGLAPNVNRVKLDALLELIDPDDKQFILLHIEDRYTPRELGEKFDKKAKWASNRLNRIKKTLKKLVKEHHPTERVAKSESSSVLVMKRGKSLPASQAA